jgi:hypothetical protein
MFAKPIICFIIKFRKVKLLFIRSDNHTTQIAIFVCVPFKPLVYAQFIYSRTSYLLSVLTTVHPLVYEGVIC